MPIRKLIKIDENKCDGCGLCVPACVEGALQIIDGKARLISQTYCDGLGACLGECPQGAISIVECEAPAYDEAAVKKRLAEHKRDHQTPPLTLPKAAPPRFSACPSTLSRSLSTGQKAKAFAVGPVPTPASQLRNWPIQLHLAPLEAPYFKHARLLLAADCVPFALADFHSRLLPGRTLLIACPKLDNTELYLPKLAQIFSRNLLLSIEIAFMEVPCCGRLVHLVKAALATARCDIPLTLIKVGIRGDVLSEEPLADPGLARSLTAS